MSYFCSKPVLQELCKQHPLNKRSVKNKGKVCAKFCQAKQKTFFEWMYGYFFPHIDLKIWVCDSGTKREKTFKKEEGEKLNI